MRVLGKFTLFTYSYRYLVMKKEEHLLNNRTKFIIFHHKPLNTETHKIEKSLSGVISPRKVIGERYWRNN